MIIFIDAFLKFYNYGLVIIYIIDMHAFYSNECHYALQQSIIQHLVFVNMVA